NTSARNRNFVYDAGGRMLWTDDGTGNHIQRQLVVNGEALGQYGETVAARVPLNGAPNYTLLGYSAHATFDFASQRMSGLGTNPGVWVVREGDTLQSIAKSAYGDPSLWYRIAEANGLSDNADLVNGQALTLPVVLSNASNVNTFTPYDPSKLVGDITPTMLDLPQPKQDKGCGGLGQVIVIVVAAVVTYFTGGAAAGVLGNIAGYAVGGAVGSIAGQAVGIAIGVQDSFSWKAVALAAIGGGISGAVGGINLFDAGTTAGVIGNAIVRGAIGNAASQGIAVATGLQDKFSWKSVAASAVSAGIGQGLNAAMDYNPSLTGFELGKSLASGLGGSLAAQVVRGGKISTTTLASDAFGNIIGDSLAWANSTNNPSSSRYENQMDRMSDADPLDSFLARNNNFNGVHANGGVPMVNGRNFSQDAAARRAGINPAGLPTYVDSGGTPTGYGIEPSGNGILGWQDRMSTQASTVRAGDYGGSMERIARAQLGSGASQRDINNYVGQLIEINGIKNPRTVGGDWDIALPGVGTPAATNGLGVHGKDIALGESLKNAADRAQQQSDAAQTATATAKETAFDSASVFAPRDTSLLNLRPRTLADEIALQQARNTPQLRGWDPRIDGVQESTDSALLNYLSGQGNMALGGVAASITMLASGNIRTASMATDIAAPIDSLVAPMGGSGRTAAASGLRRGPPHLVPNEALETELILRGNASRAKIVEQIDNVAQPAVDAFLRLDPDARVGFRGSLASGLKGEHKIDANGNRVAFDGEVAYQKNRAEKYQSYSGEQGYDADFFVVSDKLAARYGNKTFINRDNAPRFDPSLRGVLDKFDEQLRSNPILSGMKSGAPEFRIWSEEAMSRKNNDPQTYLPLGKFK
ncbi:hypothetical protein J2W23_006194, partial [Variovorax boronicumulans]|uniref:LysM peptidoglycan-binding domain-containing protein n=1 Tax=Variovorax boronicumulans TaxID=436515 RepID=UPI002781AF85